jgi:hypothetical protein
MGNKKAHDLILTKRLPTIVPARSARKSLNSIILPYRDCIISRTPPIAVQKTILNNMFLFLTPHDRMDNEKKNASTA